MPMISFGFLPTVTSFSPTSTAAASLTSSTSEVTLLPTAASQSSSNAVHSVPVGTIVGIVGGIVALLILLLLLFFYHRRRKANNLSILNFVSLTNISLIHLLSVR